MSCAPPLHLSLYSLEQPEQTHRHFIISVAKDRLNVTQPVGTRYYTTHTIFEKTMASDGYGNDKNDEFSTACTSTNYTVETENTTMTAASSSSTSVSLSGSLYFPDHGHQKKPLNAPFLYLALHFSFLWKRVCKNGEVSFSVVHDDGAVLSTILNPNPTVRPFPHVYALVCNSICFALGRYNTNISFRQLCQRVADITISF